MGREPLPNSRDVRGAGSLHFRGVSREEAALAGESQGGIRVRATPGTLGPSLTRGGRCSPCSNPRPRRSRAVIPPPRLSRERTGGNIAPEVLQPSGPGEEGAHWELRGTRHSTGTVRPRPWPIRCRAGPSALRGQPRPAVLSSFSCGLRDSRLARPRRGPRTHPLPAGAGAAGDRRSAPGACSPEHQDYISHKAAGRRTVRPSECASAGAPTGRGCGSDQRQWSTVWPLRRPSVSRRDAGFPGGRLTRARCPPLEHVDVHPMGRRDGLGGKHEHSPPLS
ncbi:uncharacterized protein LOC108590406 [Callithrix jacchus]